MFSGKVREHFYKDSLIASSGRGFVFPYSAVRTNNPVNIKVNYTGQWTGCRTVEKSKTCHWAYRALQPLLLIRRLLLRSIPMQIQSISTN
jgi:hypothetical protein